MGRSKVTFERGKNTQGSFSQGDMMNSQMNFNKNMNFKGMTVEKLRS